MPYSKYRALGFRSGLIVLYIIKWWYYKSCPIGETLQMFLTYLSIDLDTQNDVTKQQAKANVCVFLMICMHIRFLLGKRMTRGYKQKRERSRNKKTNTSFICQGRNMVYGLRAQSPKYDRDQGSEERARGSEEWNQGSQGFWARIRDHIYYTV